MVLLESRISGEMADAVCKKLGKNKCIRSKACGFNGGIWVLWDEEEIHLRLEYAHKFFLHLNVRSNEGMEWSGCSLQNMRALPSASGGIYGGSWTGCMFAHHR